MLKWRALALGASLVWSAFGCANHVRPAAGGARTFEANTTGEKSSTGDASSQAATPLRFFIEILVLQRSAFDLPGSGVAIEQLAAEGSAARSSLHLLADDAKQTVLEWDVGQTPPGSPESSPELRLNRAEFTPRLSNAPGQLVLEVRLQYRVGTDPLVHSMHTTLGLAERQPVLLSPDAAPGKTLVLQVETIRGEADLRRVLARKREAAGVSAAETRERVDIER